MDGTTFFGTADPSEKTLTYKLVLTKKMSVLPKLVEAILGPGTKDAA